MRAASSTVNAHGAEGSQRAACSLVPISERNKRAPPPAIDISLRVRVTRTNSLAHTMQAANGLGKSRWPNNARQADCRNDLSARYFALFCLIVARHRARQLLFQLRPPRQSRSLLQLHLLPRSRASRNSTRCNKSRLAKLNGPVET